MSASGTYDEAEIGSALHELTLTKRVAFAAACAEWLYPSYEQFARTTSLGDLAALRSVVDTAWVLAKGEVVPFGTVDQQRLIAESLVPSDEDEDWSPLRPLAQNAAAAAAYALRVWPAGRTQEAVWAARQLYEAADYIVQLEGAALSYSEVGDYDVPFLMAVDGIALALKHAARNEVEQARREAAEGGARLRDHWAEGQG